jgi:hypothetical protein
MTMGIYDFDEMAERGGFLLDQQSILKGASKGDLAFIARQDAWHHKDILDALDKLNDTGRGLERAIGGLTFLAFIALLMAVVGWFVPLLHSHGLLKW